MTQDSVITPQMLEAVGVDSEALTHEVERGAVRRFADAIGDPNPVYRDEQAARSTRYGGLIAPHKFLRSMESGPPRMEFHNPFPEVLDGGSDWEFFEPVRVGDRITVTTRISDLQEKSGRLGPMLFVVRETSYVNQLGAAVATQRSTYIYYSPTASANKADSGSGSASTLPDTSVGVKPVAEQLCFEDVSEGVALPTLEKNPTTQQLVMYAGASGDFYAIHYDQRFAGSVGLPDVVLYGALKSAFLAELLTDWIGERGTLRKLSVQYRGMDFPGRPLYCKGVVTGKRVADGEHLVECDVWTENSEGVVTSPGTAVVTLPSRSV